MPLQNRLFSGRELFDLLDGFSWNDFKELELFLYSPFHNRKVSVGIDKKEKDIQLILFDLIFNIYSRQFKAEISPEQSQQEKESIKETFLKSYSDASPVYDHNRFSVLVFDLKSLIVKFLQIYAPDDTGENTTTNLALNELAFYRLRGMHKQYLALYEKSKLSLSNKSVKKKDDRLDRIDKYRLLFEYYTYRQEYFSWTDLELNELINEVEELYLHTLIEYYALCLLQQYASGTKFEKSEQFRVQITSLIGFGSINKKSLVYLYFQIISLFWRIQDTAINITENQNTLEIYQNVRLGIDNQKNLFSNNPTQSYIIYGLIRNFCVLAYNTGVIDFLPEIYGLYKAEIDHPQKGVGGVFFDQNNSTIALTQYLTLIRIFLKYSYKMKKQHNDEKSSQDIAAYVRDFMNRYAPEFLISETKIDLVKSTNKIIGLEAANYSLIYLAEADYYLQIKEFEKVNVLLKYASQGQSIKTVWVFSLIYAALKCRYILDDNIEKLDQIIVSKSDEWDTPIDINFDENRLKNIDDWIKYALKKGNVPENNRQWYNNLNNQVDSLGRIAIKFYAILNLPKSSLSGRSENLSFYKIESQLKKYQLEIESKVNIAEREWLEYTLQKFYLQLKALSDLVKEHTRFK